jgi:putative hydrolase of HD superfamily
MTSLIRYLEQVNHLKLLPRTGWLLNGVRPCESVADHTCAVALLTLALAGEVNLDWVAEGLERPLDMGRMLALALLHDLAEAVLTDLPKRSAELIGRDLKHAAEADAMQFLLQDIAGGADYMALWREYDEASTPEARLVRDADKLELVHQALVYARAGNRNLDEFWAGHRWHYRASGRLYDELVSNRR